MPPVFEVLTALAFLDALGKGGNAPAPPPGLPYSPPPEGLPPGTIPAPAITPVLPVPPPFHMPPPGDISPPPSAFPPIDIGPAVMEPDVPPAPAAPPGTLPVMPPWGGDTPAPVPDALPPFPGPGWVSDIPVSPAVVSRAQYWNPVLWNYASRTLAKPYAQEQFGGRWLTFAAAWHPGDVGPQTYMATEAWRLASALPMPTPVVAPQPQVGPAMPPAGVTTPDPVSPYPGPSAYRNNADYIRRYQIALTFLSRARGAPTWDPKGVDGKYGPNTAAAVKAFQRAHGLTPVDGFCGAATAAALDQELGYHGAAPSPGPVAVNPAAVPAVVVQPATPTSPAVLQQPAPVSPYPGPGAYQKNAAYITRYQNALTFLAHASSAPALDPQGVDGKYGPHTAAAVKAFQAAHGLTPVDGFAGAATAAALDAAVNALAASHAA